MAHFSDLRGTSAGAYLIEGLLGEGGMGSVWRARHGFTGRLAAIKVLHAEYARDEQHVQRFLREAHIASHVEHTNLVRIYDVNRLADGQLYVAMEFLDGSDLGKYLASAGKQPADEIIRLAGQIGAALEQLHRAGVVHRDLKPENVFLTQGGKRQVRVVDFGLAKTAPVQAATGSLVPGLTKAGVVAGTAGYMAPEQAFDFSSVDERADVYALGMVVCKMATGALPFLRGTDEENTLSAILQRTMVLHGEPAALLETQAGHLPPAFRQAILGAIAPEKCDRFRHPRDLCFALARSVPDGEKILRAVAGEFFETAPPSAETVQNPTGEAIPTQLMAVGQPRTGDTLLGAAGATTTAAPMAPKAGRLAALGVGAALIAAGAVTAIALTSRREDPVSNATLIADAGPSSMLAVAPMDAAADAAVRLRKIRIVTDPPAASIAIDGEGIGMSPIVAAFPAGSTVAVAARLDGYEAAEQAVVISATTSDISLVLRPVAGAVAPAPLPSTPAKPDRSKRPKRSSRDATVPVDDFEFDPTKPLGPS